MVIAISVFRLFENYGQNSEHSILDVAAALDPPLELGYYIENFYKTKLYHEFFPRNFLIFFNFFVAFFKKKNLLYFRLRAVENN